MASDPEGAPRPRVLLLEPDTALRRLVQVGLTEAGFSVTAGEAAGDALDLATKHHSDALVLGIASEEDLPVLALIKERFGLPTVVMSELSDEQARGRALGYGADDFLLKPFDLDELISRLRFLLGTPEERMGTVRTLVIAGNRFEIDHRRRLVKQNEGTLSLSRTEWALIRELAERPGEPCFDGELLVNVFGAEYRYDSEFLGLWITRLRGKLGDDPRKPSLIRRYHGAGYLLAAEEQYEETAAG